MDAKRAHLDAVKKAGLMPGAANTDRNKAPGPGRQSRVAAAATVKGVPQGFVARHTVAAAATPAEYELPDDGLETETPAVDITGTDGD